MILVVDDDKVLTGLLRKLLEDAGFRVTVANDGKAAYQHLSDPDCKCMLLDMRMPQMNGAELLLLMAAEGIRVPVILMATFPDFTEEELKQFPNVRRLFQKPFYPEEMLDAIHAIVGKRTKPD